MLSIPNPNQIMPGVVFSCLSCKLEVKCNRFYRTILELIVLPNKVEWDIAAVVLFHVIDNIITINHLYGYINQ